MATGRPRPRWYDETTTWTSPWKKSRSSEAHARHAVSTGGEAYARGQTAGRNIVLHRGVKSAAGPSIRQLPPAR
jgi:hypothetical protein